MIVIEMMLMVMMFVPSLTAYKMIKKMEKNHPKKQVKKENKREREIVKIFDRSFRNPLQWNIERPTSKLHSNIYCSDTEYPHICQSRCPSKCPTSQTVKVKKKTFQTALNFDEPQFIQESVFCSNCFFHFCSFHHKAAANLCIANFENLFYEQRNFVSIVDFLTCHFQEGWTLKVF